MRFFLFALLFLWWTTASSGQDTRIKFGKVSATDLAMKTYEPDTEAVAVMLSKTANIKYDVMAENFPLSTEVHVVIKLLKEPALDEYGNARIPYYSYNNNTKISNVRAMVHLPDGTNIKVENSQMFDEKTNDFYSSKKIAFPKLMTGAIFEYEYVLLSNDMFSPVDWFFQSDIPVRYTELYSYIPDWFEYVTLTQGSAFIKNTRDIITEEIVSNSADRSMTGKVVKSEVSHASIKVPFVRNIFIDQNVPALKRECCVTSMENYYRRVRFRLNAVHFPDKVRRPILETWSKVAEELYSIPEWGGQLKNKRPGELVLEAAAIDINSLSNQTEIATKLYDYVNHHIQWNNVYGYGGIHDITSILKTESGSSGDLNKLICAALLQSGVQARPVLLSTRENGNMLEIYPFVDQFNHMIVLATLDGKDVWIDAGDKYRPLGMLRTESLNKRGWLADETNPAWIDIKPSDSKTVYLIKGRITPEGILNADVEARFTGYDAVDQRIAAADAKEKYGGDLFVCNSTPVKVSGMELINISFPSLPFQLKGKIIDETIATATPERIYFSPILPVDLNTIPFRLEERAYPIEMPYPLDISIILDLVIPEGYIIESLPEPIRFVPDNGGIQVVYNSSQNPGKVNITMKFALSRLTFDPEEYATIKNLYTHRKEKFNEQIVLVKS
jgi:hypothetical protein